MIRIGSEVRAGSTEWSPLGVPAAPVDGDAGSYCAWAGRTGVRRIFAVEPLGPGAPAGEGVLGRPGILFGVRREPHARRVLWSAVLAGGRSAPELLRAIALLRQDGRGELHHHAVAGGASVREAVAADLGRPRLEAGEAMPLAS